MAEFTLPKHSKVHKGKRFSAPAGAKRVLIAGAVLYALGLGWTAFLSNTFTLAISGGILMGWLADRTNRVAVVLAPSLLTITAGRRLLASAPRTGSKSTQRISPRRIS